MTTGMALGILLLLADSAGERPTTTAQMIAPDDERRIPVAGSLDRWIALPEDGVFRQVTLDLVRVDIRIEAAPSGRPQMLIRSNNPAAAALIALRVRSHAGSLDLVDLYPARSRFAIMPECLPPADEERGDFWAVDARLSIVLRVPPGVEVIGRVRDGVVRDLRKAPAR